MALKFFQAQLLCKCLKTIRVYAIHNYVLLSWHKKLTIMYARLRGEYAVTVPYSPLLELTVKQSIKYQIETIHCMATSESIIFVIMTELFLM